MITYPDAIHYIYGLRKYGIKLGLKNISYLLSLLDNPHLKTKVIHIGGTNGKGSTTAILSSILQSSGYEVGIYTSPHLVYFQERIKINHKLIPKTEVCQLLERIRPLITKVATTEGYQHPTFFEVITAMAYLYFYENKIDFAIMEVGLGGRLDATNVCQPLLSIITHIDYDHMDRLGNTLSEIAAEKGAIIKKETPVISAKQFKEARLVLQSIAKANTSPFYLLEQDITYSVLRTGLNGNDFHYQGIYKSFNNLHLPLIGKYQVENATLAIAATELLQQMHYSLTPKAIEKGLLKTEWAGRFEIINKNPFIILDGAHNPNGVIAFVNSLTRFFPNQYIIAILAIFSDKDFKNIIKSIVPFVNQVILTMANNPRATPVPILVRETTKYIDRSKIIKQNTIDSAIETAVRIARPESVICITGSLYAVGEAKAYFLKQKDKKID